MTNIHGDAVRAAAGIALPADYARLVRLCARLSGDAQAAEDLAQDTLVEAWRQRHKLREPAGWNAWLAAIARNVCLRWVAARQRDQAHIIAPRPGESAVVPDSVARIAGTVDLEVDLERAELATLVDEALALLPPVTRAALIARYMDEAPQAAVAVRLGLSESAVEARLHRGKLALRRALGAAMREDAAPVDPAERAAGWADTRLWCPLCSRRHLQGRFDPGRGAFALRCPACYPTTGLYCSYEWPALFSGVRGYKPALGRVMRWANSYYRPALARGTAPCLGCGRLLPVRREQAPQVVAALDDRSSAPGVHVHCERCDATCSMRLSNLTLYLPQAWQFWRAHPRMRTVPDRAVEVDGRAALVTRFQSATGGAYLDVVTDRATYAVLGVHDGAGA
jgi:RNA polymerase sigma-70 factor (ECF subfamily)